MADQRLEDRHLAELHELAAKLEVPSFRLLQRDDLVAAIRERGGEEAGSASPDSGSGPTTAPARPRRRGRRRRSQAEKPAESSRTATTADAARKGEDEADEETEPVEGILDVMPRRYGFLRLSGLESAEGDVYISASQIRRCELLSGDQVGGPARKARRGERHPALVHVDTVNGSEPSETERRTFEDLTPVPPTRRLELGSPSGSAEADTLLRAVDLLAPLALGQRVLVRAGAKSGRTTLLRGLAGALSGEGSSESPIVIVALIDERPEEATRWREQIRGAQLAVATAEMRPGEQVASAELALARAKRLVESGTDVVLIVDSLSRLAVAHDDTGPVKHLFGSGRETKEDDSGSLTVVATLLEEDEDGAGALRAVATTESAVVRLDPELAAAGIFPALDTGATRSGEESELLGDDELEALGRLRERLSGLEGGAAARELADLIGGSADNPALLREL